ncbi:EF-hand domain-containing protein [Streptomyces sp. NPDC091266]|uniref:EF-hand domain-containing protein n=1 Tax=Streptomyces sp. NPDC091266 TaxID=3365978 RepID=UPI003801DA71
MSPDVQRYFSILDANKDGHVTLDEMRSVLKARGIAIDPSVLDSSFKDLDRDQDAKLTLAEFSGIEVEPHKTQLLPVMSKLVG